MNPALLETVPFVVCTFIVGIIYYGIGLYWLLYFDARIYALAFVAVAPSFAVYFLALSFLDEKTQSPVLKILTAPVLWILIQKSYALTPIGTIATEVPFYGNIAFFQIASVTGFAGLGAAVIGLNRAGAAFLKKKTPLHAAVVFIFIAVLTGIYFFGQNKISNTDSKTGPQFAVVQSNFPVSGKWRLEHAVFIRAEYRRLAFEAAKAKPDMIIFPLYSFPDDALRNPDFFTGLAQETKTWILAATYIPKKAGDSITRGFFDAALLYSPEGKLADYYQAVQAPPFRQVSESTGSAYKILETPFGKLGILLCYEDSLPKIAKKAVRAGAEILITLSNPGQFNSTHMPYYHLMQDRLRAIESNRWLIRASANGYSAVIDPSGRFIQRSKLDKEQILQVEAGTRSEVTFYHRNIDWLTLAAALVLLLLLAIQRRKPIL